LRAFWGALGSSWIALGVVLALFGPALKPLRVSWGARGSISDHLGRAWSNLGVIWGWLEEPNTLMFLMCCLKSYSSKIYSLPLIIQYPPKVTQGIGCSWSIGFLSSAVAFDPYNAMQKTEHEDQIAHSGSFFPTRDVRPGCSGIGAAKADRDSPTVKGTAGVHSIHTAAQA